MRIATYNVEWFTELFDDSDQLIADGGWSRRHNVTRAQQTEALGTVFQAMDADAVMVIEAPDHSPHRSTVRALEGFAARFGLRIRDAVLGFSNDTQQEIALLYDRDTLSVRHAPSNLGAVRFDQAFELDVDVDARPDPIRWSKPPLELEVTTRAGRMLRMIGVHAKSKAPHGARSDAQAKRISIENRRKQLAQCIWLRRRVEAHLQAGDDLIVLGDFNDGPGLDEYEKLFGRSGVEIVLGEGNGPKLYDPHASQALQRRLGAVPTTARFYNRETKRYLSTLLDYIMISDGLRAEEGTWRIFHPFDDPACYTDMQLREALLTASDHFPVVYEAAL
ncbi:endonuclease/exonuclease/phosphatase family protein [Tropicimonas sp. S265A]|uniref:endonuclease/exonuclease/phosphatase family protein n=1 Tax=Tropicimonas sp. S265A TaxID=3415134 RepID=UPI003C7BF45C